MMTCSSLLVGLHLAKFHQDQEKQRVPTHRVKLVDLGYGLEVLIRVA